MFPKLSRPISAMGNHALNKAVRFYSAKLGCVGHGGFSVLAVAGCGGSVINILLKRHQLDKG